MGRMRASHMHAMVLGPPHQVAQLHIALVNITVIIIAGVHAGIASVTGAIRPVILIGKARLVKLCPIGSRSVSCFIACRMLASSSRRRRLARQSVVVIDTVWRSRRE